MTFIRRNRLSTKKSRTKRRNSLLTDVRLAKNMWTHFEQIGYSPNSKSTESNKIPENKVTWGFTYMNRRHFVEFVQRGAFGQIHSISVDERMIEKVEVDKNFGFGPANYRIWLTGFRFSSEFQNEKNSAFQSPKSSDAQLQQTISDSPKNDESLAAVRFPCVITLSINKFGQTQFCFSIDGMQFEQARFFWIVHYLKRTLVDRVAYNGHVSENFQIKNSANSDEEHYSEWEFSYKGHSHRITFHHRVFNGQWDVTVDSKQAQLHQIEAEAVVLPSLNVASTQPGHSVSVTFLVAGLPCFVEVYKKDFEYFYKLYIDSVPFSVYREVSDFVEACCNENDSLEDEFESTQICDNECDKESEHDLVQCLPITKEYIELKRFLESQFNGDWSFNGISRDNCSLNTVFKCKDGLDKVGLERDDLNGFEFNGFGNVFDGIQYDRIKFDENRFWNGGGVEMFPFERRQAHFDSAFENAGPALISAFQL